MLSLRYTILSNGGGVIWYHASLQSSPNYPNMQHATVPNSKKVDHQSRPSWLTTDGYMKPRLKYTHTDYKQQVLSALVTQNHLPLFKIINTCLPSGWLKNAKPKIQHVVKTCCLLLSLTFHLFSSFLFPHQCVPQACDWLTTFVYSSTSTAS